MLKTIDILERLISFKSVSPNDDGGIKYIAEIMSEYGFKNEIKEFYSEGKKTTNLYSYRGSKGENFCLSGHIDVVPPGDLSLWNSDPFIMTIKDERIYGRGACDMKSSIAAFISALCSYDGDGKVSLLITSDEETGGYFGMPLMLEHLESQGHKIDFTIVGEPTSSKYFGDIIKNGRRGSINFILDVNGVHGHVAYPDLAENPNRKLSKILEDLQLWQIDEGNEYFQKSNLEITSIDTGNTADNVIPSSVCVKFNIRYNNILNRNQIEDIVKEIIERHTKKYKLDSYSSSQPFITETNEFLEKFKDLVESITGKDANFSTTGGTSDARYIKKYSKVLEFGPLNATAHHINENIELSHLQKLYSVYISAINLFHRDIN
jgi:succinyl-diaminopimelate desuccinylase